MTCLRLSLFALVGLLVLGSSTSWRVKVGEFVPSPLPHQGFLYAVLTNGVVLCLNADTGEQLWKERLSSNAFRDSPILVGEHILVPGETGKTHVFRANPEKLEVVAENQFGKQAFASPAACGGYLYLRVVEDNRQEMLDCIGRKPAEQSPVPWPAHG
jgi:outer membrane protein assembly factor BamB